MAPSGRPPRGARRLWCSQQQPEEAEIDEVVLVEQPLEVDLQVGRPGHGRVVAQQAQHLAVAHQRPEGVLLCVEVFLGQTLRRAPAALLAEACIPLVQFLVRRGKHQGNSTITGQMGDGETPLAIDQRLGIDLHTVA